MFYKRFIDNTKINSRHSTFNETYYSIIICKTHYSICNEKLCLICVYAYLYTGTTSDRIAPHPVYLFCLSPYQMQILMSFIVEPNHIPCDLLIINKSQDQVSCENIIQSSILSRNIQTCTLKVVSFNIIDFIDFYIQIFFI